MKSTTNFKNIIEAKLQEIASKDPLFAVSLQKENKNIDDCITYILNQVKNSGCNGFEDDEIYNMAIHYYDEDNLEIGKAVQCNIVTNQKSNISEQDPTNLKQNEAKEATPTPKIKLAKKQTLANPAFIQPSLFD